MKKYQFTPEGMKKYNGAMDLKGEELNKDIQILSGDGEWKHLHGIKLFVDTSGVVIRGMDPFIGRKFSDLERLNFSDIFTVHRTVARAIGQTHKSTTDDLDNIEKEKAIITANEYLDVRLKETEGYFGYRHESMDQI